MSSNSEKNLDLIITLKVIGFYFYKNLIFKLKKTKTNKCELQVFKRIFVLQMVYKDRLIICWLKGDDMRCF